MPTERAATQSMPTPPATAKRTRDWGSFWRGALTVAVVLYTAAIFALWAWMRYEGDRSWAATLFLFGPRWVCALPLVVLVPAACFWHHRMLWLLAIAAMTIAGPIAGFQLHLPSSTGPVDLRVMTFNVNQSSYRPGDLAELVDQVRPDIVALQETNRPPPPLVWPDGWHTVHRDEMLVASRYPIRLADVLPRTTVPGKLAAIRYLVELPSGPLQFFVLHLPTPRYGLEAVLDRKQGLDLSRTPEAKAMLKIRSEESRLVSQWIAGFPGAKLIAGDFNTPVESTIFRRYWSDYRNSFSTAGFGFGFTKVTEAQGWSYGARIDHILYTPPWHCVGAWVADDLGSDHLPLVAEFQLE